MKITEDDAVLSAIDSIKRRVYVSTAKILQLGRVDPEIWEHPEKLFAYLMEQELIQQVENVQDEFVVDLPSNNLKYEDKVELWELTRKAKRLSPRICSVRVVMQVEILALMNLSALYEREAQKAQRTIGSTDSFGVNLLKLYKKCMISGCDAEQALEAAHIKPYKAFQ